MAFDITAFASYGEILLELYKTDFLANLANLTIYSLCMAIYVMIVWHYYRTLSKRDIFNPKIKYPGELGGTFLTNLRVGFDFFLKYFIIFPFISFFWFLVLSAFLLFLSKGQDVAQTLLMSMTVMAASRITAYYNEEASENVAKIIPLGLLGVFIVDQTRFSLAEALAKFTALPQFLHIILQYLSYVVLLEVVLRLVYSLVCFIQLDRELKE
ncbi:hypothetical protein JXC34_05600 [Candidatus Woesearchaeota archaeon]|nr:hypothetical protein [Candidatus Woesearchaeota archaeon]